MRTWTGLTAGLLVLLVVSHASAQTAAPDRTKPAARAYTPGRTPWGDPDLQGNFTNKDENGIPLERPSQFEGRSIAEVSGAELERLTKERNDAGAERAAGIGGAETGAGPIHWYEHYDARNSRPWLITEPADGRIPPTTPDARARVEAAAAAFAAHGESDSAGLRSLYD